MRQLLRRYLQILTRLTLRKHQAPVIAVVGNGANSMVRELVFQLVNLQNPAIENNESPEAEFSVPLTVLGVKGYPRNNWEWLKVMIKVPLQILFLPKFFHYFILEVDTIDQSIRNLWLEPLDPKFLIVTGNEKLTLPTSLLAERFEVHESDHEDIVEELIGLADQLEVEEDLAREWLNSVDFPEGRINFHPGINGSVIIDATHYFYPTALTSVLELVDTENADQEEQKYLVSEIGDDLQVIAEIQSRKETESGENKNVWIVNAAELGNPSSAAAKVGANSLIILRGYAPLVRYRYRHLFLDGSL